MEISLEGKKVLVGGSSAGIGKGIAIVLASCGADVILMARNEDKLREVASALDTAKGQRHSYIVTDFNDYQAHKEKMDNFFANEQVDILVNNTNGPVAGNVLSKGEQDYQQAFDLLFQNSVYTTNLAIPYMREQRFGRVINVSSMTVKEPSNELVLSNTMRTALVSWSKSLASEMAKYNVTVNTVLTGYFDTDRLNALMKMQADKQNIPFTEAKEKRISSIPMGRLGEPEEYGNLVAFLASDYSSFLTGTSIPLDGGAGIGLL
ncbi:SDR family oxidoreductase [Sphingobacterium deserti]|uniref:Putative short-chain dehydrogenase/reductase n=1 Tax=Sphingobacterium deserti TaxID=1229276 RepID=A0A0B8SZJ8_9SPHI|nr:SDR family oxidoreductase [Sphingobacterium deserti]KGE13262.1 putative short-chain dehydrogenase/reductase [Sphingobacterium deserti]